ncbi:MAG: hypothetical protein P4L40_24615 [Terracidiphilus sp.]|nr:hypothetical protein [Terracidiphilus sp.]
MNPRVLPGVLLGVPGGRPFVMITTGNGCCFVQPISSRLWCPTTTTTRAAGDAAGNAADVDGVSESDMDGAGD